MVLIEQQGEGGGERGEGLVTEAWEGGSRVLVVLVMDGRADRAGIQGPALVMCCVMW